MGIVHSFGTFSDRDKQAWKAATRGAVREWIMGWPHGWATGVEGISRTDQLKVIGNGVVPQQAVHALRLLLRVAEL